ncbi:MAG: hypothetical protein EYC69_01520 [Bacteroidetes bacterium]|nr:MAG: hypothetical protein EYC69_01520 [Bacteroidota bacterium]
MKLLLSLKMNSRAYIGSRQIGPLSSRWAIYFLVLLVSLPVSLNARESRVKAFCNLSRPERCWVLSHPFVASKAWKLTKLTRKITLEISKDTLLDGDKNGGQVDAFRHTFWLALLSQNMHWRKAFKLSEAHEKGNYHSFKKGKEEDGIVPDSAFSVMDRYNNRLGIEIGLANKFVSRDTLIQLVVEAILNGDAKILSKNSVGEYLDCDGNIIAPKPRIWNIPRCLISSDKRAK